MFQPTPTPPLQETPQSTPPALDGSIDAPAIQPLSFPSLPFADNVSAAAVSPDGQTVYVAATAEGLNIGAALDDTFHVWCPLLCLILFITGLRMWVRTARRSERRGEPHCRNCWYNLASTTSSTCPECGAELIKRKPRIGRSKLRRLWLPVTLCAVTLVGGMLASLVAPRGLRGFFASRGWYSATLGEWTRTVWDKSKPGGATRITWIQPHSLLYALDVSSGQAHQLRVSTANAVYALDITSDGLVVAFASDQRRLVLAAIDPQAQTVVGRLPIPSGSMFLSGHSLISSETPEGEALVALTEMRPTNTNPKTTLLAWNPRTSSGRVVLAIPTGMTTVQTSTPASQPPSTIVAMRGIVRVPGNAGARYVSFPDFPEASSAKGTILHWFDESGTEVAISQLKGVNPFAAPGFSADGSTLYFPGDQTDSGVREWSMAELLQGNTTPRRTLNIGMFPATDQALQLSADGRFMLVGRFYDQLVRDTQADRWHARLANDTGSFGLRALISLNGETVAAVAQTNAKTRTLLVWRVPRPAP